MRRFFALAVVSFSLSMLSGCASTSTSSVANGGKPGQTANSSTSASQTSAANKRMLSRVRSCCNQLPKRTLTVKDQLKYARCVCSMSALRSRFKNKRYCMATMSAKKP